MLQKYGSTYASPRSFNNHYGVPLSLSNLEHNHSFGVFEIGMSKTGEIHNLSKLGTTDLFLLRWIPGYFQLGLIECATVHKTIF